MMTRSTLLHLARKGFRITSTAIVMNPPMSEDLQIDNILLELARYQTYDMLAELSELHRRAARSETDEIFLATSIAQGAVLELQFAVNALECGGCFEQLRGRSMVS